MYVYIIAGCNIGDYGCVQIGKYMNNLTELYLCIVISYKYSEQ